MEQKRTLWIVAAVGVFLLVVLGAALILYTPAARPTGTVATSRGIDNGTASNGWISLAPTSARQNNDTNEQIEDEKSFELNQDGNFQEKGAEFRTDEVNVYADKANVYSEKTDLSGLGNNSTVVGTVAGQNQNPSQTIINNTTTIDLTEPTKPVVVQNGKSTEPVVKKSTSQVASAKENNVSKVKKSTKIASEAKSSSAGNVAKTVSVAKNVSKKSTKATNSVRYAKVSEPEITKYWVQVTALTSRKSADEARERLGENEITADVFTYTDNRNRLFYRVRVGPYTTKSEAEYWRNKIAKIDSFQNTSSYITSTTVAN